MKVDALTVFEVIVKEASFTDLEQTCTELRKSSVRTFMNTVLKPSINMKLVKPLYPDSPHHPQQKYGLTELGKVMMGLWKEENKEE